MSVLRSTITLCSLIQGTSIQPNFSEYRLVAVPADESMAANVLRINGTVCMHAGFHQTADLLRTQGFDIKTVDISEFLKAEAGLTCMSITLYASHAQTT